MREPLPQVLLVVCRAQRGRADELGALEAVAEVVERQEQVLRARLGVGGQPLVPRLAHRGERLARREVDDVDRDLGHLGEADDRFVASPSRIGERETPW